MFSLTESKATLGPIADIVIQMMQKWSQNKAWKISNVLKALIFWCCWTKNKFLILQVLRAHGKGATLVPIVRIFCILNLILLLGSVFYLYFSYFTILLKIFLIVSYENHDFQIQSSKILILLKISPTLPVLEFSLVAIWNILSCLLFCNWSKIDNFCQKTASTNFCL